MKNGNANRTMLVDLTTKTVTGPTMLTDWIDVSHFADVYVPIINVDSDDKDSVTFVVEMAEDRDFPFQSTQSFTLAPGQSDAYLERDKFYRWLRLVAQSVGGVEAVDVRFGVFAKGERAQSNWKLG